jgi:hypothetical protein
MRRIFWGFCRNWFLMSSLHYLSSRSDFGFEFAKIFILEKRLPLITDTGSRRLGVSVIRGVANSSKISVRDLGQSDLCKNIGKTGSLPCPLSPSVHIDLLDLRPVYISLLRYYSPTVQYMYIYLT